MRDRIERLLDDLIWVLGRSRHVREMPRVWMTFSGLVATQNGMVVQSDILDLPGPIRAWCDENLPGRWRTDKQMMRFRYAGDMLLFSIHWSEEIAEGFARDAAEEERVSRLVSTVASMFR